MLNKLGNLLLMCAKQYEPKFVLKLAPTWSNCKSSWYDRKHWIPLGLDADPMVCKHRVSWQPIMCNFKFHKTWLWNMLTRQHSMDLDLAIWVQCASLDCLPENEVLQYCVFWVIQSTQYSESIFPALSRAKTANWHFSQKNINFCKKELVDWWCWTSHKNLEDWNLNTFPFTPIHFHFPFLSVANAVICESSARVLLSARNRLWDRHTWDSVMFLPLIDIEWKWNMREKPKYDKFCTILSSFTPISGELEE